MEGGQGRWHWKGGRADGIGRGQDAGCWRGKGGVWRGIWWWRRQGRCWGQDRVLGAGGSRVLGPGQGAGCWRGQGRVLVGVGQGTPEEVGDLMLAVKWVTSCWR